MSLLDLLAASLFAMATALPQEMALHADNYCKNTHI